MASESLIFGDNPEDRYERWRKAHRFKALAARLGFGWGNFLLPPKTIITDPGLPEPHVPPTCAYDFRGLYTNPDITDLARLQTANAELTPTIFDDSRAPHESSYR